MTPIPTPVPTAIPTPNLTPGKSQCKIDRLGIFKGAENRVEIEDVKTVFTIDQDVKVKQTAKVDHEDVIDLCDESDEDEIEMVAVVTNDNKKYKCIKLEDEEEIKRRKNFLRVLECKQKVIIFHRLIFVYI